jgi:hypothetical protein
VIIAKLCMPIEMHNSAFVRVTSGAAKIYGMEKNT